MSDTEIQHKKRSASSSPVRRRMTGSASQANPGTVYNRDTGNYVIIGSEEYKQALENNQLSFIHSVRPKRLKRL